MNWTKGIENTKLFEVPSVFGKEFLQGCRTCDSIVELNNMFKKRQLLGNCYQSLCNCSKCGEFIVFDEHKLKLLKIILVNSK